MIKTLLYYFFLLSLCGCHSRPSPRDTAQQYITAVYTGDWSAAAALSSKATAALQSHAPGEKGGAGSADSIFEFPTLAESVEGNKATVSNGVITLSLVKEGDDWRVVSDEKTRNAVQQHEAMLAAAHDRWEALLSAFDARMQVLKEYVSYKNNLGAVSPNLLKLNEAISNLARPKEWTRESILSYTQQQANISHLVDGALEPSMAANTDLSLNYFVQISKATDLVQQAKEAYVQAAVQVPSSRYAALLPATEGAGKK